MAPKKVASKKKDSEKKQCQCYTEKNRQCSRKANSKNGKYCKQHANKCKYSGVRDLSSVKKLSKGPKKRPSASVTDKLSVSTKTKKRSDSSKTKKSKADESSATSKTETFKTSPNRLAIKDIEPETKPLFKKTPKVFASVNNKAKQIGGDDVTSFLERIRAQKKKYPDDAHKS